MKILDISKNNENKFNTAIALGNFDGIHLGHETLIKAMIKRSKELDLIPSLLLFQNHTRTVIENQTLQLLTGHEQRLEIAKDLGVKAIYTMDFNRDVMKLSPEEFIRDILIKKTNCKAIVAGFDYRFGHKASGNVDTLVELGKKYNLDILIIEPIFNREEIISSTKIKGLIKEGRIKEASNMLGRNFSLLGKIIPGKNIGHTLGFPTANVELRYNYIIPKLGVYVTKTIVGGKEYLSATNVGYNPTFNEDTIKIETHILDFHGDIYGEPVEIQFIDYLREEKKFPSKDELIEEMKKDIDKIKKDFGTYNDLQS